MPVADIASCRHAPNKRIEEARNANLCAYTLLPRAEWSDEHKRWVKVDMKSSTAVGIGKVTGFEPKRIRSNDTALLVRLGGASRLVVLDVDVKGLPDATPDQPRVQTCEQVLGAARGACAASSRAACCSTSRTRCAASPKS
jgi:hypothetical protein